jgi:hypothetical protein
MKPSVGRIVHRVASDGECLAAIITQVWSDEMVNLATFLRNGSLQPETSVKYGESGEEDRAWHWPELVRSGE